MWFYNLFLTDCHTHCVFVYFQLIYLKVTALLFPTSDFRHPVTTPAMLYMSQALTKVQVNIKFSVTTAFP